MKSYRMAIFVTAVLLATTLLGCSSSEKPAASAPAPAAAAKPEPKEPALYTGQEALARMTGLAQRWAPDAQPVRMESELTEETTGQAGKSTIWRAYFASPSRGAVKTFVVSGSRLPDAPAFGVTTVGGEVPYTPEMAAVSFQAFLLKTDSDKAYALAQEHGGENLVKKDPKQPVTYVLEGNPKQHVPLWYVIYGKGANNKGIGVINGQTGTFLRASK
ncbi:MAG: hypothetical protein ACE14L_12090 [Terriglobales bacterium]